jgi:hypothetical protein
MPSYFDKVREMKPRTIAMSVVLIVSWGYLFVATSGELLQVTVWSIPFVLMIGALSTPWRSVSWSNIFMFFLAGMGPAYLLTLLLQWLLNLGPVEDFTRDLLESTGIVFVDSAIWAPLTEELAKVTPLLFVLLWARSGFRTLAGPIDYAVVAGTTGAGLAFAEDITVHISQGYLFGPTSSVFALDLGPIYQNLVGSRPGAFDSGYTNIMSFIFPEMQPIGGVVWSGHGALAMGLGLSIGLTVWAYRRVRSRFLFVIPVVVYLWVAWEHMMANWYGGAGCGQRDFVLCTLVDLDLKGRIFPVAVLAALGLGAYMSRGAVRYLRERDQSLSSEGFTLDAYRSNGVRGAISYVHDWFAFRRWRRKAAYGVDKLVQADRIKREDAEVVLAARWRAAYIRRRLVGNERSELPAEVAERVNALTPLG